VKIRIISEQRSLDDGTVVVKFETDLGHVATASLNYFDVSRRGLQVVLLEYAQDQVAQVREDRDS
jgi:hypothetical protein